MIHYNPVNISNFVLKVTLFVSHIEMSLFVQPCLFHDIDITLFLRFVKFKFNFGLDLFGLFISNIYLTLLAGLV